MSQPIGPAALRLNVQRTRLTAEQFARLCQENRDRRFELTAQKELVIMPPAGAETGQRNRRLTRHLDIWVETDGTGLAFDASRQMPPGRGASDGTRSPRTRGKGLCPSAPTS